MTDTWNEKQLAQFARIRDGYLKTGFSEDDAHTHASNTINAQRDPRSGRRLGEGPTKDDLYLEAKRYNIAGRSKMDKDALQKIVAEHRSGQRHR